MNGAGGGLAAGAADIGLPMLIGPPIFIFLEPREPDDESARCCASTRAPPRARAPPPAAAALTRCWRCLRHAEDACARRRRRRRCWPRRPPNRTLPPRRAEPAGTSASSALWLLACIRAPMGARTRTRAHHICERACGERDEAPVRFQREGAQAGLSIPAIWQHSSRSLSRCSPPRENDRMSYIPVISPESNQQFTARQRRSHPTREGKVLDELPTLGRRLSTSDPTKHPDKTREKNAEPRTPTALDGPPNLLTPCHALRRVLVIL